MWYFYLLARPCEGMEEDERATKPTAFLRSSTTSLVTNWRALLLSYVVPAFPPPTSPRFPSPPLFFSSRHHSEICCEGAKDRVTKRYDARTSEHTIMVGYRLFFWHSRLRFYLLLASNERATRVSPYK